MNAAGNVREPTIQRTVVLAGATGPVGHSILEGLLADTSVQAVHVLARRDPGVVHARLTCRMVNFAALPALPPVDEVYLALGTTIKVAGSQAAFRAVDFDANLAVARAALAAGARRCGLVSAMGANARSTVFYSRVKGELEEALAQLPFQGLVIARRCGSSIECRGIAESRGGSRIAAFQVANAKEDWIRRGKNRSPEPD